MRLAEWIMRMSDLVAPRRLRPWTEAMAGEIAEIGKAGPALAFALGCLAWAAQAGLAEAFRTALQPSGSTPEDPRMTPMEIWRGRRLGLACAIAATGLGLVYLSAAGAPSRMLTLNLAALAAGLIIALPLSRHEPVGRPLAGILALLIGAALLLTALLGHEASGVRRWVSLGGVVLQPSLILAPFLAVAFARSRDLLTGTGVVVSAAALALQPDRAMAGSLAAGLAAIALLRRDRTSFLCLLAASVAFAVTWIRPDAVPATPFVDRVFRTAFSMGALPGAAVWAGAALLVIPAVVGFLLDRRHREIHAAFGASWTAIIVAAILADYPTPLVAYGGSAIVGYILASMALPRRWGAQDRRLCDVAGRSGPGRTPDAHQAVQAT